MDYVFSRLLVYESMRVIHFRVTCWLVFLILLIFNSILLESPSYKSARVHSPLYVFAQTIHPYCCCCPIVTQLQVAAGSRNGDVHLFLPWCTDGWKIWQDRVL